MQHPPEMKRVLLPAAAYEGLASRLRNVLRPEFFAESLTKHGWCCIGLQSNGRIAAGTGELGGKPAPRDHYGPLVVELPAYLVREDVPAYAGEVKQ